MPEAAVLIDPVPTMDAEAEVVHPVEIDMVHRTRPEDAFPRNWVRLGHDRFSVGAVLPHDHPFFAPVGDDRHDPLLVAEAMRQAAMLAFHAGYGIPVGYQFLMSGLDYVCHQEHLTVGAPHRDRRGGVLLRPEVAGRAPGAGACRLGGAPGRLTAATGMGETRFSTPKAYRRMRGEAPAEGISIPQTAPVSPVLAGRARAEDVVLSETGRDGVWELRVDTRHPTLFQRPNDHVPGMLLLEAARQAAWLAVGPAGIVPAGGAHPVPPVLRVRQPVLDRGGGPAGDGRGYGDGPGDRPSGR